MSAARIGVIVGSNRPVRIALDIARWVIDVAQAADGNAYELIALGEIALPFLDEPKMPALGDYVHEHTRRWSALVSSYDAFVIVAPQYNWSYPAVVKNALDFLYHEWDSKPVAVVSYGSHGGKRATQGLQMVFTGLHMRPVTENPALVTNETSVDECGKLFQAASLFAAFEADVQRMAAALAQMLAATAAEDEHTSRSDSE